eukprot:s1602_g2.t1
MLVLEWRQQCCRREQLKKVSRSTAKVTCMMVLVWRPVWQGERETAPSARCRTKMLSPQLPVSMLLTPGALRKSSGPGVRVRSHAKAAKKEGSGDSGARGLGLG